MKHLRIKAIPLLALLLLTSCAPLPEPGTTKPGNEESAQQQLNASYVFDARSATLTLPGSLIAQDTVQQTDSGSSFMTVKKNALPELAAACEEAAQWNASAAGDNCVVLSPGDAQTKEVFLLLRWTDYNYTFCPTLANMGERKAGAGENSTQKEAGPLLYFPLHLLAYESAEQMGQIGRQDLVYREEYRLRCTPEELKAFYRTSGQFQLTDTEDGFTVAIQSPRRNILSGCRFAVRQKEETFFLTMYEI